MKILSKLFLGLVLFAVLVLPSVSHAYATNLKFGSRGADVTALQKGLISEGFIIKAGATGYFGPQTQAALSSRDARAAFLLKNGTSAVLSNTSNVASTVATDRPVSNYSSVADCEVGHKFSSKTGKLCSSSTLNDTSESVSTNQITITSLTGSSNTIGPTAVKWKVNNPSKSPVKFFAKISNTVNGWGFVPSQEFTANGESGYYELSKKDATKASAYFVKHPGTYILEFLKVDGTSQNWDNERISQIVTFTVGTNLVLPQVLQSQLEVISPRAGDVIKQGDTLNVTWFTPSGIWSNGFNSPHFVYLNIAGDNIKGGGYIPITGTIPNVNFYRWTVPNSILHGAYNLGVISSDAIPEAAYSRGSFVVIPADGSDYYKFPMNSVSSNSPDINNDGRVDGVDLALVSGSFGSCFTADTCKTDLNLDKKVDQADMNIVLASWSN